MSKKTKKSSTAKKKSTTKKKSSSSKKSTSKKPTPKKKSSSAKKTSTTKKSTTPKKKKTSTKKPSTTKKTTSTKKKTTKKPTSAKRKKKPKKIKAKILGYKRNNRLQTTNQAIAKILDDYNHKALLGKKLILRFPDSDKIAKATIVAVHGQPKNRQVRIRFLNKGMSAAAINQIAEIHL